VCVGGRLRGGGGGGVPRDRFQRLNGYVSCAEKFSGKKFVFA